MKLELLKNQNYDELANQVQEIIDTKSKDDLYEIIGNALYDSGLDVSPKIIRRQQFHWQWIKTQRILIFSNL